MFSVIIGLIFFTLYFGTVYIALYKCDFFKDFFRLKSKDLIAVIIFCAGLVVWFATAFYLNPGKSIPSSDRGYYWIKTIDYSRLLFEHPLEALRSIYISINNEDHNNLFPAIFSLIAKMFGNRSYNWYRTTLFVMFLLPSFIILEKIVIDVLRQCNVTISRSIVIITSIAIITIPAVYMPVAEGLYDVSAFLLVNCVLLWLINKKFYLLKWDEKLVLCLLLMMLLFLRRHFCYFVFSYVFVAFVIELIDLAMSKKWSDVYKLLINCIEMAIVGLGILRVFFNGYLDRTLNNNYSFAYQMFSEGNIIDKFIYCFRWIGFIVDIFAVIGAAFLVIKKRFREVIGLIVGCLFTMLLFFQVQSPSGQHYYNFISSIIILSAFATGMIVAQIVNHKRKIIVGSFIALVFLYGLGIYAYVQYGLPRGILFSNLDFIKKNRERDDVNEIKQIAYDINDVTSEESTAYLISNSLVLNQETIQNCLLPVETKACPYLSTTSANDLGQGFPYEFLVADYVLTTDKPQYWNEEQKDYSKTCWFLNELVNYSEELKDNYCEVKDYTLDKDIHVTIKKKIKPLDKNDIDFIVSCYQDYYTSYPELFKSVFDRYITSDFYVQ